MADTQPKMPSQLDTMRKLNHTMERTKGKFPVRVVIAALGVVACILLSSTRYNLSIAIVSMVQDSCSPSSSLCGDQNPHILFGSHHNTTSSSISEPPCNSSDLPDKLNWSEAQQGLALGAYYYGFAATHIFGGRLSERYGPKWVTVAGLLGAALLNAFLPISSQLNFASFVVIRVLIGAFHGVVHPALFFMFKNWFPKKEQSGALSMLLLGTSLGLIINVPIVGAISKLSILNGWPLLFYGGSALHIIWLVMWTFLVEDKPEQHSFIKDKEIFYIRQNSNNILETNLVKVPWRQILTTKALYASVAAKTCWSFNHAIIIDNGPSYLNKIAGFDMYQASVHIALVYLSTSVIFLLGDPLFIGLKKCLPLSHTRLRKIFQSIVFLGASITMLILPSVGCDEYMIIVLIVVNMLSQGFISAGEFPMINEFSGYYSGTVYGIAITFDSLARFIAPIIRGELVRKSNTLTNWNIVFYITAALNLVGFVCFELCAATTLKKWALKREVVKQISNNGQLEKSVKKELKKELENPFYRLSINTNSDDWKTFKTVTLVQ